MRRRNIPSIIMLIAGMITCVISIMKQYEMNHFITLLIVVLLLFYIIGLVVKVVLDKILLKKNESLDMLDEIEEIEENILESDEIN